MDNKDKHISEMRKELNQLLASLSINGKLTSAAKIERPSAEIISIDTWKHNRLQ